MKTTLTILLFTALLLCPLKSQNAADTACNFTYPEKTALPRPYHPEENASQKLDALIREAGRTKKRILIQAGGNWCGWCLRFNYFVHHVPALSAIVENHYLYYHLNYSPENKNEAVFKRYVDPAQRYGYPFFIILSDNGKLLCVQESSVLEAGAGYDVEKVKQFLEKWVH